MNVPSLRRPRYRITASGPELACVYFTYSLPDLFEVKSRNAYVSVSVSAVGKRPWSRFHLASHGNRTVRGAKVDSNVLLHRL